MNDDRTSVMEEEQRCQAEALSVPSLHPPTTVPGYEMERFLGKGAFGEVWVARDRNTLCRVAIKFFARGGGLDFSLLAREVEKLRFLFNDRYVVKLIEVGWEADPPYYVMEYLEQGSLEELLQRETLPVKEAVALFREVAVGLVHAHGRGVLHCDLKPANILLDQDDKPRLADFGQSRLCHELAPSLGTLFYMAPEQADLKAVPDARWDVYALGAVLYRMLTGQPPHAEGEVGQAIRQAGTRQEQLERYHRLIGAAPPPTNHRHLRGVDRALADIIDRSLIGDPSKRYPNVQAVLNALDTRTLRRGRRPLLVLGAVGPAVLVLLLALVAGYLFNLTVTGTEEELVNLSLESNRFAARSIANHFAVEIEQRWRALEREAADADLRAQLKQAAELPRDSPKYLASQTGMRTWIENRRRHYENSGLGDQTASYFLVDGTGIQLARSPSDDKTENKDWSFRDYFHGQGKDLDAAELRLARPRPIRGPHRSIVFRSRSTHRLVVAFTVPVWAHQPAEGEPIGVLGITSELGPLVRFHGSRHQFAVIVDTRVDSEAQRRGALVDHPHFDELTHLGLPVPCLHVDPEVVTRAGRLTEQLMEKLRVRVETPSTLPVDSGSPREDYRGDYSDPVGGEYEDRWLATLQPVVVVRSPKAVHNTGWVVLVQERSRDTVRPVQELENKLLMGGAVALGIVIGVMVAMWSFVIRMLNDSPRAPFS